MLRNFRCLFLVLLMFLFGGVLLAQSENKVKTELYFQSKVIQNKLGERWEDFSMENSSYKMMLDIGLGVRLKKSITKRFEIGLGAGWFYGSYKKTTLGLGPFIDNFKRTDIHHFEIHKIDQLYLDVPFSLAYKILNKESNKVSIFTEFAPQLVFLTKAQGIRFRENEIVKISPYDWASIDWNKREKYTLFNDLGINFGVSISHKVSEKDVFIFDLGGDFSLARMSVGAFIRIGYRL